MYATGCGVRRRARHGARRGVRRGVRHLRKDLWQQSRLGEVRHVLLLLGLLQLLLEGIEREWPERQDVQAPAADASGVCVGASLWAGGHGARLVDCPRAAPAALLTRRHASGVWRAGCAPSPQVFETACASRSPCRGRHRTAHRTALRRGRQRPSAFGSLLLRWLSNLLGGRRRFAFRSRRRSLHANRLVSMRVALTLRGALFDLGPAGAVERLLDVYFIANRAHAAHFAAVLAHDVKGSLLGDCIKLIALPTHRKYAFRQGDAHVTGTLHLQLLHETGRQPDMSNVAAGGGVEADGHEGGPRHRG